MSKAYVVVGNGVAGVSAALAIRSRDARGTIAVVSDEGDYFFSRTALMYAFMDRLPRRAMEPYERHTWRERGVELVRARVADLDASRHQLTLRDGRTLPYDRLLLATGSRARRIELPGVTDDLAGLVHFVTLQDLDACEQYAPTTKRAVVVGGGLIGIELVESLRFHGVAVTFLVREPWYWPAALSREEGEMTAREMRRHGVDVREGAELASVARDASGRVASVTTTAGETIACEMLGVCIGVAPQVEWLRGVATPPAMGRGVKVDATMRTTLDDVWAAGDCAELADGRVESIWYSAKRQGALAGENMSGRPKGYASPVFFNSAKLFELEYTTVGALAEVEDGAESLYATHPTRALSWRIVHSGDKVLGFNALGSRWDHTVITRWIEEQRPVDWVREHLRRAQFDVELGRAPLHEMTARALPIARKGVS
ncbi:MAG: FAD-dependent oxidoreductase [Myxococcaceae bacterium]|nr:MAG: FAD-dependent oxidoreductase [Myxococcaceae bacterium]